MAHGNLNFSEAAKDCEWYTPYWVYEALAIPFDLDVCHPIKPLTWSPIPRHFNIIDNGLEQDWGESFVWMNPPYGAAIVPWVERMIAHNNGVALVPSATETGWWQDFTRTASGVLFPKSRIQFVGHDGKPRLNEKGKKSSNGLGSSFIAFGELGFTALSCFAMSRPSALFDKRVA